MDILTLKYFIAVAETQHMTKAAQKLNITQPALSATIQRLEASMGCRLFERTGRGIRLNHYGEILLESALQIEQIMDSCLEAIEKERLNEAGTIRIACSSSPTNEQMLSFLMSANIRVEAQWIPKNWDSEIAGGQLDFVLTFGKTEFKNIERLHLRDYRAVIVAGRKHPLAAKETVTLRDLNEAWFCCNSAPHSLTHTLLDSKCVPGFSPQIMFQGRAVSDMLRLIRTGSHLGIMVQEHLPEDDEYLILPVQDFDADVPFFLYWNKASQNPLLASIRKNILDFYRNLPREK